MRNNRIALLVEVALAVALATVLNLWKITLPFNIAGGSVSLTMLPLLILAVRRGPVAGLTAGLLYGTLDLLFNPVILYAAQVAMDYLIPYSVVACITGFASKPYRKNVAEKPTSATLKTIPWMVLGGIARFAVHTLSGVLFFASYAPAWQNVWVYSSVYNAGYVGPSLALCIVISLALLPALEKAVPVSS